MSRYVVPRGEPVLRTDGQCNYQLQTSQCYAGLCPTQDGDFLVFIDMRIRVDFSKWGYVYTEAFYEAMAALFKVYIVLATIPSITSSSLE